MKTYKNKSYPDLDDMLIAYDTPGAFSKDELDCPNFFVRFPAKTKEGKIVFTGVTLLVDGVNKDEVFEVRSKYGRIPEEMKRGINQKIDAVCQSYIDNIISGDLA